MADWDLKTPDDVANALDWLRRRMKGQGLLLVAIGANSIAYAKETTISPQEALEAMEANLQNLRRGIEQLKSLQVTRGSRRREDR